LLAHLDEAGLGHVSEIADGDAPHRPAGCPFQAWSVGELLRLERCVLVRTSVETPLAGQAALGFATMTAPPRGREPVVSSRRRRD
jgi:glycogen debranching enzyme